MKYSNLIFILVIHWSVDYASICVDNAHAYMLAGKVGHTVASPSAAAVVAPPAPLVQPVMPVSPGNPIGKPPAAASSDEENPPPSAE